MELNTKHSKLIEVNDGCHELLAIDDLETLFSLRVSLVLEKIAPKLRAFEKTMIKLATKFRTVEVKDADGVVTGKRAKFEEQDEYKKEVQKGLDAGVTVKVPALLMTEIYKMREEEGLPILSSTIHKIRPIIRMDMDIGEDDEPVKSESAESSDADEEVDVPTKPKRRTRAQRLKDAADASAAN